MLFNLCLKNIKQSIKDYSIYFVTLVMAVSIFYVFNSVDAQESMISLSKQKHEMIKALIMIIGYVSIFVSIILGFLIIYSNIFLIKRRKKEIGLYLTLGMSKRKVSTILVIETLMVGIISLIVGLFLGVFLSQFLSVFTAKLFEADMSKFKFAFSSASLSKTILYFGLIFLFVMIFNIISLSRYKLIDLLNAKRKNEKIKVKNKYVTFIIFALALTFLGYAYHILFTDGLMSLDKTTIKMLLSGSIGTFLLFLSLSGFFLRIIEMNKRLYFKGLNMFILKQINNKINTTVVSTTIISLMLLLTIGILSGSMSLVSVFNKGLKSNNLTDFTLYTDFSNEGNYKYDINSVVDSESFNKYVKNYSIYDVYYIDSINASTFLTQESLKKVKEEFGDKVNLDMPLSVIGETDYNNIMNIYNKESLKIDLKENEYLVLANVDQIVKYFTPFIEENRKININGKELSLANKEIINIAVQNYRSNGNDGVIVVSDYLLKEAKKVKTVIIGNYINSNKIDKLDEDFTKSLRKVNYNYMATKLSVEASSVGVRSIVTFLGLYLGIIFAISSATILAIGQLSESSDNKERYKILREIGADNKMIRRSLFIQITICFMLPLFVALIHSYFGLRELNGLIKMISDIDIASNIFLTTIFIVIVYGGYLFATYICSKNIIEEKR